jgi:Ca-activated chloride channel homolog
MRFLFGLILALFLSVSVAEAQKPSVSPTPPLENKDCGLVQPDLVKLNVSVWGKNKGYLKGLNDRDFEVSDGKNKQKIECFAQKDLPVSVGILFDLSESMQSLRNADLIEIPSAVEGLTSFINAGNPQNEYFIIGFAEKPTTLLEPTQDKKQIENALKALVSVKPEGNTSVYDAMAQGFEKLSGGKFNKKILLVISDGMDNSSKNSDFADIKNRIKQNSDVMIYQVNIIIDEADLRSSIAMNEQVNWFERLTENSGGTIFYPKSRARTIEAFKLLADELKSQYLIGFNSKQSSRDKKDWHEVKVNLNLPKEKKEEAGKITIRTQKGFYF